MSRRRTATATRPPDAFMEAYEAEAQEAVRLRVGGFVEIVGGYSGQYNGKVAKVLRLIKKENSLEVVLGDSKIWFELRYVRAIDSIEASIIRAKAEPEVTPADFEKLLESDALTELLQEVAKDFESGAVTCERETLIAPSAEPQGFKVGDRVVCRNHPNSMDDWQIEKILAKQALCYSPAIQQRKRIDLAELEAYSPENAFPSFKVGDRVEFLTYERYADEAFTVTHESFRNGMTGMANKNGVGFSVHCSELRLLSGQLGIAPSAPTHELAPDRLTSLAGDIKAAHTDCEQALTIARSAESSALEHAKRCGELLLEAKAANGHGGWEAWRTEHTGIPSSTASLYQRIAERWDEVKELKISSLKAIDRHFRAAKKQLKANPRASADLPATPPLPPIGTKLQGKDGAIAEVVTHDGALAVVNSREGATITSSRLTAGEIGRIYQAAAEKGDRVEDPPEPEQPKPKARTKVGAGHLRAIAKEGVDTLFKRLEGIKGHLPSDTNLIDVACELEEAIAEVLEIWLLEGED